jgi:hypothetical protein
VKKPGEALHPRTIFLFGDESPVFPEFRHEPECDRLESGVTDRQLFPYRVMKGLPVIHA